MSTHDFNPADGAPRVPPTQPSPPVVREVRSSWPAVIGAIAVVMGAIGSLVWLGTTIVYLRIDRIPSYPTHLRTRAMRIASEYTTWNVALSLTLAGLAILLLAIGMSLIRRRRRSVAAARLWAALKIVTVLIYANLQYQIAWTQTQVAAPYTSPKTPAEWNSAIGGVTAAGSILWGWALPVFLLIWFAGRKIRAETLNWS